jgi:ubiquinone biosynthesis protein COQ9
MTTTPETALIIDALLQNVPVDGWTTTAVRNALKSLGEPPENAPLIFPGGTAEMIEAYCTLADERMITEAQQANIAALRTPARVKRALQIRFTQNRPHKEAIRRALGYLANPRYTALNVKTLARTVDSIWFAAADTSADFAWYTKRAILAGIYTSTLLFWLRDTSEDDTDTLAFIDRRLAASARLGKLTQKFKPKLA